MSRLKLFLLLLSWASCVSGLTAPREVQALADLRLSCSPSRGASWPASWSSASDPCGFTNTSGYVGTGAPWERVACVSLPDVVLYVPSSASSANPVRPGLSGVYRQHVTWLDLSSLNLTCGPRGLPPSIANLTALARLALYANPLLNGTIPAAWGAGLLHLSDCGAGSFCGIDASSTSLCGAVPARLVPSFYPSALPPCPGANLNSSLINGSAGSLFVATSVGSGSGSNGSSSSVNSSSPSQGAIGTTSSPASSGPVGSVTVGPATATGVGLTAGGNGIGVGTGGTGVGIGTGTGTGAPGSGSGVGVATALIGVSAGGVTNSGTGLGSGGTVTTVTTVVTGAHRGRNSIARARVEKARPPRLC